MSTAVVGGPTVLLVEDEFFQASELSDALRAEGATLLGPFPTVHAALEAMARAPHVDAAILDVNLRGEMVFSLAAVLKARAIPCWFATGYASCILPPQFEDAPVWEKPFAAGALVACVMARCRQGLALQASGGSDAASPPAPPSVHGNSVA